MDVLLLGGNNARHLEWIYDFEQALSEAGHRVHALAYAHWAAGEPEIDLPNEMAAATELVAGIEKYVVVAKSIGSVLTTFATGRGILSPAAALFLGFPLVNRENDPELKAASQLLPPTRVIQNEFDPYGSVDEVSKFFRLHGPIDFGVETIPGIATHDYVDFGHYIDVLGELSGKAGVSE